MHKSEINPGLHNWYLNVKNIAKLFCYNLSLFAYPTNYGPKFLLGSPVLKIYLTLLATFWPLSPSTLAFDKNIEVITYPGMTIGSMIHKILLNLPSHFTFWTTEVTKIIDWRHFPWVVVIFNINQIHHKSLTSHQIYRKK